MLKDHTPIAWRLPPFFFFFLAFFFLVMFKGEKKMVKMLFIGRNYLI